VAVTKYVLPILAGAISTILLAAPALAGNEQHGAGVNWTGSHGGVNWDGGHAYSGIDYNGKPVATDRYPRRDPNVVPRTDSTRPSTAEHTSGGRPGDRENRSRSFRERR
jgi:hypothetical protein